jgi:hypothetical protein
VFYVPKEFCRELKEDLISIPIRFAVILLLFNAICRCMQRTSKKKMVALYPPVIPWVGTGLYNFFILWRCFAIAANGMDRSQTI